MFTSHEVSLDARFEVASGRLVHLINGGALHHVSQVAYDGGLEMLVRVGPVGGMYGLSSWCGSVS